MQATTGYDIKQVVSALKAAGMLILDGQGKSTKFTDFKNNETGDKRFYFIQFPENVCHVEKTSASGASGASETIKETATLAPLAPTENTGASVTAPAIHGTSTACTTSTEKTDNTNQVVNNALIPDTDTPPKPVQNRLRL